MRNSAKLGEIITVPNAQRKFGSDNEYEALWAVRQGRAVKLMGTCHQFVAMERTAEKNPEDMPEFDAKEVFANKPKYGLAVIGGAILAVSLSLLFFKRGT